MNEFSPFNSLHDRLSQLTTKAANAYFIGTYSTNNEGLGTSTKKMLDPHSSRYQRVRSFSETINKVNPRLQENIKNMIFHPEFLPFQAENVTFLNNGGKHDVFKMDVNNDRFVLKVDRQSLGMDSISLIQRVQQAKKSYQNIQQAYSDIEGFIPNERFLILNGPVLGRPAIARIQPYFEGELHDIFEESQKDRMQSLVKQNLQLRNELVRVVFISKKLLDSEHKCIDILGERNLIISTKASQPHLTFLDTEGMYDYTKMNKVNQTKLNNRLNYLERILL